MPVPVGAIRVPKEGGDDEMMMMMMMILVFVFVL